MNKKNFGFIIGVTLLTGLISTAFPTTSLYANESESKSDSQKKEEHQDNNPRLYGSTSEVHISDNGMVLVRGAKVTAIAGNVISASMVWGSINLSWTINNDTSTYVIQHFGEKSNVTEISVGDFISFQGQLVTTSANLTVNAKVVKNWSGQKKNVSLIGKVSSLGTNSFVLNSEEKGQITVTTVSTTVISKADATITFSGIHVGDKVLANGTFDSVSRVLSASKVKVYVDKMSLQHVFEGKLKVVSGSTLPASLTLSLSDNNDVAVNIPVGISIIGKSYLAVSLADFKVGDKIRVWGLREGTAIDATVVRNVDLPR